MKKEEFIVLAEKISDGTASQQDITLYNAYYNYFQQDQKWDGASIGDIGQVEAELKARIGRSIQLQGKNQTRISKSKWIAAAAVLLLTCSSGYLFFRHKPQTHVTAKAKPRREKSEIIPGGNKAVLTLADGSQIVLNEAKNGILTHQGDISVRKLNDGRIVYKNAEKENSSFASQNKPEAFNTITTPRGGQFQIDLPDGTKVWLNSASTLRYPAAFKGRERIVMLSGEAYFEVAHVAMHPKNGTDEKAMPFKVIVNNQEEVQVLGTHFNVMGYPDDDKSKTTLLEGSVKIINGDRHRILVPGQQAQVDFEINVSETDTEAAVAWKNGQILFKDEDLKTIMRQVSRWYDVDIKYNGNIPKRLFSGGISRKSNLSSFLKIMELSDIHFNVHGKTITVTP